MTVRLRGAEAVKAPPLLFRAEHRIPLPATSLPGIYAPEIRHMGRLPDSDKSVRSKYRLKINLSACRFENKVQFCNPEKTVPDARPASDYFSVYATTIGCRFHRSTPAGF